MGRMSVSPTGDAILGTGSEPLSGFKHSGPFTETVLLGNLAPDDGPCLVFTKTNAADVALGDGPDEESLAVLDVTRRHALRPIVPVPSEREPAAPSPPRRTAGSHDRLEARCFR